MTDEVAVKLDQPLPADAVVGGLSRWFGYRRYPVFSGRWLWGRLLYLGAIIFGLSALTALANLAATGDAGLSLGAGGLLLGSFTLMFFAGPSLACWVRHRRWSLPAERVGVVAAVLLGIVLSYFADRWASNRLEPLIEERMKQRGVLSEKQIDQAKETGRSPLGIAMHLATLGTIYFLMGGGLALSGYFSEQRRLSESQRRAELNALRQRAQHDALKLGVLQAQVEPHFLFNTLASIRSLVKQDPSRAEATLDALVEHLRACMPRLRGQADAENSMLDPVPQSALDATLESTLRQQLEICRSYLELMRLRLGERFNYRIAAPDDLLDHGFPPLLLITLVENAIKHGIEPKPGATRVELLAERVEQAGAVKLRVRVIDDGAGLQPGSGSGVGLANVRAQLATRFGAEAALSLQPRAEGGAIAELVVPLHSTPA